MLMGTSTAGKNVKESDAIRSGEAEKLWDHFCANEVINTRIDS